MWVECCLLCAVNVTKWNPRPKVNSAIWPTLLCTLGVRGGQRKNMHHIKVLAPAFFDCHCLTHISFWKKRPTISLVHYAENCQLGLGRAWRGRGGVSNKATPSYEMVETAGKGILNFKVKLWYHDNVGSYHELRVNWDFLKVQKNLQMFWTFICIVWHGGREIGIYVLFGGWH